MKCPQCKNELEGNRTACDCGWEKGPGGRKQCHEDGPRDLLEFGKTNVGFRMKWASDQGMYRDGGLADQD